jgi:hypothetical protein
MSNDLVSLTNWRLDQLEALLRMVPEDFLTLADTVEEPVTYDSEFSIETVTNIEWLQTLFNWARYYGHLFPGETQCQNDEHRDRWSQIFATWTKIQTACSETDDVPEKAGMILQLGTNSLKKNRWVHDFLRPDQMSTVEISRNNLAALFADYYNIHQATIEEFLPGPSFDFFLNSPVFHKSFPVSNGAEIKGLGNANLIDASTGTGKTRMSLVANISYLCWSNNTTPFAPQKAAVFVRTRSQTQSFLKETRRFGLTAACPISASLGCSTHNKINKAFVDQLFDTLTILKSAMEGSLRVGSRQNKLLEYFPAELYERVAEATDSCITLSKIARPLYVKCKSVLTFDMLLAEWTTWLRDKNANEFFSDLRAYFGSIDLMIEKENAINYLSQADGNCANCPANPSYHSQLDIQKTELRKEQEDCGHTGNQQDFFESRLNKNADINLIAEQFQREFGLCGRTISRKNMATADVVIFTYNWLVDPAIAQHARKVLKINDDENLNPSVSAICDEAHFLFDYNEDVEFDASTLLDMAGKLWHTRLQFFEPSEFHFTSDTRIPNIHRRTPLKPQTFAQPFDPSTDWVGESWYYCDSALKAIAGFLEKFPLMKSNQPTPQKLFQLATGFQTSWYPHNFYTCADLSFNFGQEYEKDKVGACYKALDEHIAWLREASARIGVGADEGSFEVDKVFDALARNADWEGVCTSIWLKNAIKLWQAKGSHNRVVTKRMLMRLASGMYNDLSKLLTYVEDFILMLRECIYAIGTNQFEDRILSISAADNVWQLKGWDIFDFTSLKPTSMPDAHQVAMNMSVFLNYLSQVGQSESMRDFTQLGMDDLLSFYKSVRHGSMFNLKVKKDYGKVILASFKVNKPFIQTALRPYCYVTFLTGTAPQKELWRNKSGFRYLSTSEYPLKVNCFDVEIDDSFELKQATKSPSLLADIAAKVIKNTQTSKTLVCYPSKATMKEITSNFPEYYSNGVIVENENVSLDDIQAYFEKMGPGSVHVVAGGRFVEGIECTDENGSSLIKRVIIVGVPFNPPSEENEQLQSYYARQFGWNQWECMDAFMYDPVKRKVRQAIGRSVRNLTDRGHIILIDARYKTSKMLKRAINL